MKKYLVTFAALTLAAAMGFSGAALAQGRGGGGGGFHGGGSGGGGWSGGSGGNWNGGGWHGGSGGSWNGGNWNGGWHGGSWNNGWNGGWRGPGWGWCGGGWCGAGWGTFWWPGFGVGVGWPGVWGWPGAWGWPSTFAGSAPVGFVSSSDFVTNDTGVWLPQDPAPVQAAPPAPSNFWFYCTDPAGYFPYVKNCNKQWMPVIPQSSTGSPLAPRLAQ